MKGGGRFQSYKGTDGSYVRTVVICDVWVRCSRIVGSEDDEGQLIARMNVKGMRRTARNCATISVQDNVRVSPAD